LLDDIAIIGCLGRFPGRKKFKRIWQNLQQGKESITFFDDEEIRQLGIPAKNEQSRLC